MLLFSEFFWVLTILLIFAMISSSFFLWITDRGNEIKIIDFYFIFLFALITLSRVIEQNIYKNFRNFEIILVFDIELIITIVLFSVLYFTLQKSSHSASIIYIHAGITLLICHIILSGIVGLLIIGTIIIGLIGTLVFILVIPYDIEYKLIATTVAIALSIYIAVSLNELFLTMTMLGVISLIISTGSDIFRSRLVAVYQTTISASSKIIKSLISPFHKSLNEKSSENKNELKKKTQKKRKTIFWQSRVKISQGILDQKTELQKKNEDNYKTWLQDFFSNKSRYGLELVSQKNFRWTFLLRSKTQAKARIRGEALLTRLLSVFSGADGDLEIVPITKKKVYKDSRLWEIKLPQPPYIANFTLINDFINLFHRNTQKIKMHIMWKKATARKITNIRRKVERMKYKDEDEKKEFLKRWRDELYKIRIFVKYKIQEEDPKAKEIELQKIEGRLKSLTMSGRNLKKAAHIKSVPIGTYGNILRLNLFSGRYVTPLCVDFNIPETVPLVKPFKIDYENINYISKEIQDPDYILIGKHIADGRRTEHKILIDKKSFAQSVLVAGQQGTGKTYLLAQIVEEFYKKAPDIGILVLNLGKGGQEGFYKVDRVIKFGTPEFRVPYYVDGQYLERSIQETASYLIASTGLKNIAEKNMVNVMQAFIEKKGKLPRSLKFLFKELVRYFKQYPYHVKFQTNILRAIKNRVLSLLSNSDLQNAMNLSVESRIPAWFKEWRNGKKIYLDLSRCTVYEKRLLTNAIFQLIRALTPDIELGKLQNIILIDEAHQILEKSISNNYDDDDYISREQLEKNFNELLREFRSKGLAFILSDQTPSRLFGCVALLPSLKIIFRVGYPCNTVMIGNPKEQEFLMLQKNRQALILNGITGEKYVIETLDFEKPELTKKEAFHAKNILVVCSFCGTPLDCNLDICVYCGNPSLPDLGKYLESINADNKNSKESDND